MPKICFAYSFLVRQFAFFLWTPFRQISKIDLLRVHVVHILSWYHTVSCRTSYFHLTPNIFFCAIQTSPRGPGRIPTASTNTAFLLETKRRLFQYILSRQESGSVTYCFYRLFPTKTKPCLLFFFPFFLFFLSGFSWLYTPTSHSKYIPRIILTRFILAFVLFSFFSETTLRLKYIRSNCTSLTLQRDPTTPS